MKKQLINSLNSEDYDKLVNDMRKEKDTNNITQLLIDTRVMQESINRLREVLDTRFALQNKALELQANKDAEHFENVNNFNKRLKELNDEKISVSAYDEKHIQLQKEVKQLEGFMNKVLGISILLPFIVTLFLWLIEHFVK